jgi:hypothetical protein
VAYFKRDLSFFKSYALSLNPKGMMGGGSVNPQGGVTTREGVKSQVTPRPKISPGNAILQTKITFPTEGQYVVFVHFWPRVGDGVSLSVPLSVGSTQTLVPVLTQDTSLTQKVGDLQVSLKTDGALKANQYNYINFDVIDAEGQLRSDPIQVLSGDYSHLDLVDEALTTYLRPDFINRHKLQFSAFFPKPGTYKAWFNFYYAASAELNFPLSTGGKYREWFFASHPNQQTQLPFVINVQ